MWIHRIAGSIIVILTFILSLVVFGKVKWRMQDSIHAVVGLVILIASGILGLGGYLTRYLMNNLKWKTNILLWIRFSHIALGYIMLLGAQFTILTGGLKYSKTKNKVAGLLCIAHCFVVGILFIACEIFIFIYKKREVDFVEPSKSITKAEFDQRV